jgi:chromosome segregation ATPase
MCAAEEQLTELRSELALERAANALQNEGHAADQRKLVAALARQSGKLQTAQHDLEDAQRSVAAATAQSQLLAARTNELIALRESYVKSQSECRDAIAAFEAQRAEADRERQRAKEAIEHAERASSEAAADARLRSEAVHRAERAEARAEAAEQSANAAAARALQLEARLRTAEARVAELEGSVEAERASRQQAETLARSRAEQQDLAIRELESKLSNAVADCERLLDDVEERGARAAQSDRKQRDVSRLVDTVRKELQGTRADEALRVLAEREEWICLLLDEVRKRRVVPRDLLEHERLFLEAHGKTSKP